MDDKKPDVAVGELLREIDDWITVYDPGDVSLAGHLLRRAHAALSALPAEPKQPECDNHEFAEHMAGQLRGPVKCGSCGKLISYEGADALTAPPAAEQQKKTTGEDEQVERLYRFYNVNTKDALIEMQERRIEKLQARLPALRDTQPRNQRKG